MRHEVSSLLVSHLGGVAPLSLLLPWMCSMSALRIAAERIRAELCYGGSGHAFYGAIADWLDNEATTYASNDAIWNFSSLDPRNLWAERGLTVQANLEHHYRDALAVARAYLGESA